MKRLFHKKPCKQNIKMRYSGENVGCKAVGGCSIGFLVNFLSQSGGSQASSLFLPANCSKMCAKNTLTPFYVELEEETRPAFVP